jgi:Cu/Zn superoxide dismutase
MRTTTAMTLLLTASVLVACDTRDADETYVEPGLEQPPTTDPVQTELPDETMVSLSEFEAVGGANATGTAMPVRGSAELRRVTDDGALELHVRLEGLSEGDHAWHIHGAPCGQQGDIVVPLSRAGTLEGIGSDLDAGADGVVEERVTIDAERARGLDLSRQHSVNVHQGDGDNPGPAIACANIGGTMGTTAGTPNR